MYHGFPVVIQLDVRDLTRKFENVLGKEVSIGVVSGVINYQPFGNFPPPVPGPDASYFKR